MTHVAKKEDSISSEAEEGVISNFPPWRNKITKIPFQHIVALNNAIYFWHAWILSCCCSTAPKTYQSVFEVNNYHFTIETTFWSVRGFFKSPFHTHIDNLTGSYITTSSCKYLATCLSFTFRNCRWQWSLFQKYACHLVASYYRFAWVCGGHMITDFINLKE